MATIRAAMIAAAAFTLLHATAPAQAQSRQTTAGAPLQLVPGAAQATRAADRRKKAKAVTRSVPEKPAKKAVKAARTPEADARRVARTARKNIKAAATAQRRNGGLHIRTVKNRPAQRAIAAAVPEVREREKAEPLAFAPRPSQHVARPRAPAAQQPPEARAAQAPEAPAAQDTAQDNVMRDGSSVALVGRLPWWRNNALQPIRYGSAEAESQVLAAADSWLLANAKTDTRIVLTGAEETIVVADAREVNAIDRALASVPAPAAPMFWYSLIAILGGALAAAAVAAASARYMFA